MQELVIVIVSFNCREALHACLASARGYDVIVVDNASHDGTAEMVRAEFPEVKLIDNEQNRGFAAACNQGIKASQEPFILLLNPDTVINAAAIERLVEVMNNETGIGACGPRLLNPDGSLQPSCRRLPTLGIMALAELGLRSRYLMRDWPHDALRPVPQLMGACLLLRRAALERIGLFDERFFLYFEEVDICWRLAQAGWRVVFVPDATITHVGGQSSRTVPTEAIRHRYRSLFAFYRKHFPRWQLCALKAAVQAGAVLRMGWRKEYTIIAREVWRL